ncbi:MAG: hypothetical protein PF487_11130 [Bacteroidales bacterium]|jgi:heme/copper-type cytochrome/quinol oxidase subunit 2|nr:hypothetical protein [Bacteroidales bacterium]
MKNKIITILVVGVFLYSVWSYREFEKQKNETWTPEQIEEMIQTCISSSDYFSSTQNKEMAYNICQCVIDSIIQAYSYQEVQAFDDLNPDNLRIIIMPIMEKCMAPYNDEIRLENHKTRCMEIFEKKYGHKKANDFCDCLVPYLLNKYDNDELSKIDSILPNEIEKIKECSDFD